MPRNPSLPLRARSHASIARLYRTPRYNHNPIELHAVTVAWNGGDLRIHDASQALVQTAWTMAQVFGLTEEQVHVSSPYVGGGFGCKTLWHHHILAAAAAKLAHRPVRLTLSREGVYRTVGGRTLTEQRVAIGATEEGRFEALIHSGVSPRTAHNTMPEPFTLCSRHLIEAWRTGAERFGWSRRAVTPGKLKDGKWLIGMGCATATYPYYRMPGGVARLGLGSDGKVRVEIPAHEMGMGTQTTHTLVIAERLGLPIERVTVAYGDSRYPGMFLAGGSSQSASIGAAIIAAHRALVTELLKARKNSVLSGLTADEVGSRDGGLVALNDDRCFESYTSILAQAGLEGISVEGHAPEPLEVKHWSMHSYGALFCEVRVNVVTGELRISRFLGSYDCGRILNAKTAAGQFRGGIIMGLGLALMEETQFDERSGRVMNPSVAEYHVPVHMDVPHIEVIWTDIPDPHTPMGARGIGEIGITGVAAAVANAVYNACGRRVRELPITLDKML